MSIKWARAALSHSALCGLDRKHLDRLVAELAEPWHAQREGRLHHRRGRDPRFLAYAMEGLAAAAATAGSHHVAAQLLGAATAATGKRGRPRLKGDRIGTPAQAARHSGVPHGGSGPLRAQ